MVTTAVLNKTYSIILLILFFFILLIEYKESDGTANHVHQTLGNNTSKLIIIAIGSTLGGNSALDIKKKNCQQPATKIN